MQLLGSMLLLMGLGSVAFAQDTAPVPEISPLTAVNAVCLVAGVLMVARGRKRRMPVSS